MLQPWLSGTVQGAPMVRSLWTSAVF